VLQVLNQGLFCVVAVNSHGAAFGWQETGSCLASRPRVNRALRRPQWLMKTGIAAWAIICSVTEPSTISRRRLWP